MKRFGEGLMAVIMVVCFMGFIGYDFLTPVKGNAAEEKAVKAEKATKEVNKEPAAKAAAPAKKAKKKGPPPVVMVTQQVIPLAKTVSVDIIGTGFEPDQELRILYADADGMQTDIGYALEPEVKANKSGAFFTTWDATEFIKAKLIEPGAMTLTVTNSEFKSLAETNLFFKKAPPAPKVEKKEEKKVEKKADAPAAGEKKEKKEKKAE